LLPSSQESALFACWHPFVASHVSVVQTLPSSHDSGEAPTHLPPEHVSTWVQTLLSVHPAVLFVCTHPLDVLHESSVQTLPSSQFGALPPVQVPVLHVSRVVHAFPSSHDVLLSG
jgi:hypothetical protein